MDRKWGWMLYSIKHAYIGVYRTRVEAEKACHLGWRRGVGSGQRHMEFGIMPVSGLKEALSISERLRRQRRKRHGEHEEDGDPHHGDLQGKE